MFRKKTNFIPFGEIKKNPTTQQQSIDVDKSLKLSKNSRVYTCGWYIFKNTSCVMFTFTTNNLYMNTSMTQFQGLKPWNIS